jgi:hypothetical protein
MAHEFRTCVATPRAWQASGGVRKHVTDWLATRKHLAGSARVIVTPTAVHLENAELEKTAGGAGESREEFIARLDRGELDVAAMESVVAEEMASDRL